MATRKTTSSTAENPVAERSRFDLVNAIESDLYDAHHLAALASWIEQARQFIERAHFAATNHAEVAQRLRDVEGDGVVFGPEWQTAESEGLQAVSRAIERNLRNVRAEVNGG